ncbi:MAG TPA: iron hydrogenase [Clostridia bacterium]|jgi:iron only hydrogenase large subunit-like protein|nr:[Fe-Fe] hydrogenase large subunit C-terminal domain-containing protein [Clostridia bacterium]HHY06466.1 iron hydrogenase [Clostridia bacterium]
MEELTYDRIFGQLVKYAYAGRMAEGIQKLNPHGRKDLREYIKYASGEGALDKVVFKVKDCLGEERCKENKCQVACLFHAIVRDEEGKIVIKEDYCTDCGECVQACNYEHLVDKKEFIPLVKVLQKREVPVYAIVAPAFIGQFGIKVTPGKLRMALKRLGFYGMVEVALFADILSLKEALEFDEQVRKEDDFVLTSCCCPLWVAMIKKIYYKLIPHVSPSVSPMVACGRAIKKIHPEAKVAFIGPCIAKKAEAKEPDVKDAVDYVLTFQELAQVFAAVEINPVEETEDPSEHSSLAGRIYAYTGGVSQAVTATLERIRPEKRIKIKTVQADGVRECKKLLRDIEEAKVLANFYEGMGCEGGCVGGPKANLGPEQGREQVYFYGQQAHSLTPADNLYVLELLKVLGFQEIAQLLEGEKSNFFKRKF